MRWAWRRHREQDLERELRAHLELEAEERRDAGLSAEDARYAARRMLGNRTSIQEEVREMWGWATVEQIAQDTRYAFRGMRKSPGFALTAVLSLALGIGANTAIFTVVHAVLLKPLPFPQPDRLVQIWESQPAKGWFRNVVNPFNFLDWRERTHSFEEMAAVSGQTANLTGLGDPLALAGMRVSPQYFSILGVFPALGRPFSAEEGRPGQEKAAILSFGIWQSRFGGDPSVVGRKITIDGAPSTIVGVMPRGFALPKYNADVWTPLPIVRSKDWDGGRYLTVVARLKPGVTLQQAQADLHSVANQIASERPRADEGWSAEAVPMLEDATENVRLPLLVLLAAVGLVLLIACANVANLLLMRAAGRLREIAVRAALGAGEGRLLRQMLSESLVLALAACAAGLAAAHWGVQALLAMVPRQSQLPRMDAIHMDGPVFLFALALSMVTAAIFGLVPSLQVSQLEPYQALQQGVVRTPANSVLRRALVVAEIALSLILLTGAGLMLRSFHRLVSVHPGFETQHILTMGMFTSPAKYLDNRKRAEYFGRMLDEIRTVTGVREAGTIHFLPLQERVSGSCFALGGEPPPSPSTATGADFLVISPGYFQAMGTPLLRGRQFDGRDGFDSPSVIMVNQEFVKRFLQGRDAIGQKLNVCWTIRNPVAIVGVVADTRQTELQKAPSPTIFVDNLQAPMYFAGLVVRAAGDPGQVARAVESAIHRVDPEQAITHVETMEQVFSDSVAQPRLQLVLLVVFGGIAGLLAMIGIYGVVAYSAARRTREIGIRMALGALPNDVRRLILRESMLLAALGIGIGLAGALALTRVLRSLLFETTPADPATLASVVGAVLLIVVVATLIPANRAARIHPTVALRYE
jgi:predicted permease